MFVIIKKEGDCEEDLILDPDQGFDEDKYINKKDKKIKTTMTTKEAKDKDNDIKSN